MRKLKYVKFFENFILNEGLYDDLNGYTLQDNKDKQKESGFIEGDKVHILHKNLKGDVIQEVPAQVDEIWKKDNNWVVIVKKNNGRQAFGTDSTKFSSNIDDLKKV